MKLLLVFAFFAFISLARTAPTSSTTSRKLILPDYHDTEEDAAHDGTHTDAEVEDEADEEEDTTITTTTTRRSSFAMPTRNRNLIPSRRPIQTERTRAPRTTTTTTTVAADADIEEQDGYVSEYDGDFKYVKDFRKYIQKLLEDIRRLVQNFTGYNSNQQNQQRYHQYDDDE